MKRFLNRRSLGLLTQVLALVFFSLWVSDFSIAAAPVEDHISDNGSVEDLENADRCQGLNGCVHVTLVTSALEHFGQPKSAANTLEPGIHTSGILTAPPIGPPKLIL